MKLRKKDIGLKEANGKWFFLYDKKSHAFKYRVNDEDTLNIIRLYITHNPKWYFVYELNEQESLEATAEVL